MPTPQLVVADAAYKTYPGGVIAVRCSDWLGAGRGSLSTEIDSRSCTGTVVRDTQKVTTAIVSDAEAAYDEALDTFVIPLSSLPIVDGDTYMICISYLAEGEWDITEGNLGTRACRNHTFNDVCAIGAHGPDFWTEDFALVTETLYLRKVPYFYTVLMFSMTMFTSETLTIRAFSQSGTTIEWLLDQLIFLPWGGFGSTTRRFISPSAATAADEVDGADGGDAWGEFTRNTNFPNDPFLGGMAADWQRKSNGNDAEYLLQITTADGYTLADTVPDPDEEHPAHGYSLHCARWTPAGGNNPNYTRDEFSRTIPPAGTTGSWGITPEGFGWDPGIGAGRAYVNGSVGVIRMEVPTGTGWSVLGGVSGLRGADLLPYEHFSLSGKFRLEADADWRNSPFIIQGGLGENNYVYVRCLGGSPFQLVFDLKDLEWIFQRSGGATHGPVDVSGWYSDGSWVGFRITKTRYKLRVRVWDASGAEPTTWDFDDWMRLSTVDYPYTGQSSTFPYAALSAHGIDFVYENDKVGPPTFVPIEVHFDDIEVNYDPDEEFGAVPTPMHVRLERPEGTTFGEIEIPWGAAYMVYWGSGDFTDAASGTYQIAVSMKVWNEPTAPDLQRAETSMLWFRWFASDFRWVSMNWRSAERRATARRVLLGG